ncbi:hypothetical protein [Synechococcus sp. CCY 9618]|uniref:hypothetical protein n=1 Tax=Synechococcus sp. CCY 9618 TaxID=2815602 RepID=UPI001C22ABBF|nr:hypothetical protein [Synechococcus sp. CCY 9618]
MARILPISRPGRRGRGLSLRHLMLLAGLPLLGTSPLLAATELPPFPPSSEFRSLQLITLACSRENSTEPCDRARSLADPLMDHPRLPASCKDVLWDIRQLAKVAASNSYDRREGIDRAARILTDVCRQKLPAAQPTAGGPPRPQGGLNLISPSRN